MKQNVIIGIVVAVVVAGGVIWYFNQNKAEAPATVEQTNNADMNQDEEEFVGDVPGDAPDAASVPSSATVAVSTQVPGDSVTIDNVFLEKAGFVAIHEVDASGKPGAVIGSSGLLSAGAKQDLEIRAAIKPGGKYLAMLHSDDGDKKFNATADVPVLNNNIAVMTMFSVSQ